MTRGTRLIVALCLLSLAHPALSAARSVALDRRPTEGAMTPTGCAPLAAGIDSLPMTARLVIDDNGHGEPFVLRLSSAGQPPVQIQRAAEVGGTIETELLQLELRGRHPRVGSVILRKSATQPSLGQITEVVLDGNCQLTAGSAHLDVFFDLEVLDLGEHWIHPAAVRLESSLGGPLTGTSTWEVAATVSQPFEEQGSLADRGALHYVELIGDPPFPPPGEICSEVFFTADVQITGEPGPVQLVGFGSSTLELGAVDPGGTCNASGVPCATDSNCNALDFCRRPKLATEFTAMPVGGFDLQLGSWALDLRPVLGDSDCCEAHPTGGCTDATCEALICGIDSFCCNTEWDRLCADLAATQPTCEQGCFDPLATPSSGSVSSSLLTQTYPATRTSKLYISLATQSFGELHNAQPISVQPPQTITNLPTDPLTELRQGATPVPLLSAGGAPVGQISSLISRIEEAQDCTPPPAAALLCRGAELELLGDFPGCPGESLSLVGLQRVYRDDPRPGVGFGQKVIDTLAVESQWDGVGACLGALTVRLAPQAASLGSVASLTPEEFFPAVDSHDLHLQFEAGSQLWIAGALNFETTIPSLPAPDGERFLASAMPVVLLDAGVTTVGQLTQATLRYGAIVSCPADAGSYITFSEPDELDLRGLGGGEGATYHVLKGDLGGLKSAAGSLAGASCHVAPSADFSDSAIPAGGQGFYYVARDGFGPVSEDWDSGGVSQVGDRDASAIPCP